MLEKIKQYFFPFLVALSAFSLAGAAAFFSVTGLSKLFGGAQGAVIIMASSLEFSKLVTASFLHKYWKTIDWKLKTYLTVGTITIMFITSAGIYGFLSSAYSETSNKLDSIDGQISLIEQKKTIIQSDIDRLESGQELKQNRIQSLITLRSQQESRVDSLYSKGKVGIAKRVEDQINQSNSEITKITTETDDLSQKIQSKNDEIAKLETEILTLKNNDVAGEVGPLKYISKLTGYSMDSVVNFFILLLIFVFDPMAVCLVLATNITLERVGLKSLADVIPKKKEEEQEVEEVECLDEDEVEDELGSDIDSLIDIEDEIEFVQEVEPEAISSDEAVQILNDIKLQGIQTNEKYQLFLDSLYMNGELNVGDTLPSYSTFVEDLQSRGVEHEDKEVLDFLTICNLLKVTDMNGSDRRVAKDYAVAKGIFKVLSSD